MKTKIAIALATAGVLGAGSAAALVNTQILDSGVSATGASSAVLPPPSTIDLIVPTATYPPTTTSIAGAADAVSDPAPVYPTASTEPTVPTLPPSTLATAPPAPGYLTAFTVGEAGIVTVDVLDGRLVLVATEPGAGWALTHVDDDGHDEVNVSFESSDVRVEFTARLVDGKIVPEVATERIHRPTPTTPTTTPDTTPDTVPDDDGDDGEDGDDGGDDEDHDDEGDAGTDDDADDGDGGDDDGDDGDDDRPGRSGERGRSDEKRGRDNGKGNDDRDDDDDDDDRRDD